MLARRFCLLVVAVLQMLSLRGDGRQKAKNLLRTWCDAMIGYQLSFPTDKSLNGGLVCPACGFLHGRICDSVYGFIVQWGLSGEEKYLHAAERVVEWTEENMLRPGGYYRNDKKAVKVMRGRADAVRGGMMHEEYKL